MNLNNVLIQFSAEALELSVHFPPFSPLLFITTGNTHWVLCALTSCQLLVEVEDAKIICRLWGIFIKKQSVLELKPWIFCILR